MTRALFIGRFQPFHKGHYNAAKTAMERYDLAVGIGSAATHHTRDNPLTFQERKQILENCFPELVIHRFEDKDDNDAWTDVVEETVDFEVIISGNDLVRRLLGERGYTVEDPEYLQPDRYSGTAIRHRVIAGDAWESLVPDCSRELLERFGFEERLKQVAEN